MCLRTVISQILLRFPEKDQFHLNLHNDRVEDDCQPITRCQRKCFRAKLQDPRKSLDPHARYAELFFFFTFCGASIRLIHRNASACVCSVELLVVKPEYQVSKEKPQNQFRWFTPIPGVTKKMPQNQAKSHDHESATPTGCGSTFRPWPLTCHTLSLAVK